MTLSAFAAGALALTIALSLGAGDALADGKDRRGRDDGRRDVHRHHPGPPPWARAYGYRDGYRDRDRHVRRPVIVYRYAPRPAPVYAPSAGRCDGELLGSLAGGATGALVGAQFGRGDGRIAAVAGGTIVGFLFGGNVGRSLDRLDYACAGQVLEHVPSNRTVVWRNPDAGATYQVTPIATYQRTDGRYCREYQAEAVVAGQAQQVYGTACRQPDGSWEIVN